MSTGYLLEGSLAQRLDVGTAARGVQWQSTSVLVSDLAIVKPSGE